MPFQICQLSVQTYARGFTTHHYYARQHKAKLAEVLAHDYFNDAAHILSVGDMILISAMDAGTIQMVVESEPGRVVLAPLVFGAPA